MTVNKARRVTVASCWILIVTCGCWPCDRNESEHFPNICGVNLSTLCGQPRRQTTEQRSRKQILTDREAAALNQHQEYVRHEEHGTPSILYRAKS